MKGWVAKWSPHSLVGPGEESGPTNWALHVCFIPGESGALSCSPRKFHLKNLIFKAFWYSTLNCLPSPRVDLTYIWWHPLWISSTNSCSWGSRAPFYTGGMGEWGGRCWSPDLFSYWEYLEIWSWEQWTAWVLLFKECREEIMKLSEERMEIWRPIQS